MFRTRTVVLCVVLAATTSFLFGFLRADQRMETNDGFCHFQIDPNDADVEVFAANCVHSIYADQNGQADGATTYALLYPRGRTPIGNVNGLLRRRDAGLPPPRGCVRNVPAATAETPPEEDILCRRRLTGERTGAPCNLVDSNGTQYATNFWTAIYDLTADGTVTYSLDCRNADQQN